MATAETGFAAPEASVRGGWTAAPARARGDQAERRVFWTLQAVWWPATAALYIPMSLVTGTMRYSSWPMAISFAVAIAGTFALRAAYLAQRKRALGLTIISIAALTVALASFEAVVNAYTMRAFTPQFADRPWNYFVYDILNESFYLLCWTALYIAFTKSAEAERQRARLAHAESLAREAQLSMLRFQLNPHFLFNTLNAISSLVLDGRAQVAERMIVRLSTFLRYSLDGDLSHLTPLSEELEAQRLYLQIEQERFGDKLRVRFDAAPEALDCLAPRLILQPLVENAVKHAIAPSAGGGEIIIRARLSGETLELSVLDDGPGAPQSHARSGIGLRNTAERLHALYGDRGELAAGSRVEGGFRATVRLPRTQRSAEDARAVG